VEELTGSLLSHEARINLDVGSLEHAFKSKVSIDKEAEAKDLKVEKEEVEDIIRHRKIICNKFRTTQSTTTKRGRQKVDRQISIQCFYCKKYGHFQSECRKKQFDLNKERAHVSKIEGETSEALFLSCQLTEQIHNKDVWLLDSGCSNHMTGNHDLFLVLIHQSLLQLV
jgi:hypothetical protein